MDQSDLDQLEREEPDRSLAERLASINPLIKPGVQATVALYYALLSQRSSYIGHP